MKQILLSTLFLFTLSFASFAQSALSLQDNPVEVTYNDIDLSDPFASKDVPNYLLNSGNESLNVYWTRENQDVPAEWEFLVCDGNNCYDNGVLSNAGIAADTIDPSEESTFKITVRPKGVTGTGTLRFDFALESDPSEIIYSATYSITVDEFVSNVEEINSIEAIDVYPNPVKNLLSFSNLDFVDEVIIYNMLGKAVKVIDTNVSGATSFDINGLNDGVYLVSFRSDDYGVVKTSRVVKKGSRP